MRGRKPSKTQRSVGSPLTARAAVTEDGLGWFQHDYRGRRVDFHTGSIDGMVAIVGLLIFGLGWGFFDCNNMPILCQFVSPRHRAASSPWASRWSR